MNIQQRINQLGDTLISKHIEESDEKTFKNITQQDYENSKVNLTEDENNIIQELYAQFKDYLEIYSVWNMCKKFSFDIKLTTNHIKLQYDRYKQSLNDDNTWTKVVKGPQKNTNHFEQNIRKSDKNPNNNENKNNFQKANNPLKQNYKDKLFNKPNNEKKPRQTAFKQQTEQQQQQPQRRAYNRRLNSQNQKENIEEMKPQVRNLTRQENISMNQRKQYNNTAKFNNQNHQNNNQKNENKFSKNFKPIQQFIFVRKNKTQNEQVQQEPNNGLKESNSQNTSNNCNYQQTNIPEVQSIDQNVQETVQVEKQEQIYTQTAKLAQNQVQTPQQTAQGNCSPQKMESVLNQDESKEQFLQQIDEFQLQKNVLEENSQYSGDFIFNKGTFQDQKSNLNMMKNQQKNNFNKNNFSQPQSNHFYSKQGVKEVENNTKSNSNPTTYTNFSQIEKIENSKQLNLNNFEQSQSFVHQNINQKILFIEKQEEEEEEENQLESLLKNKPIIPKSTSTTQKTEPTIQGQKMPEITKKADTEFIQESFIQQPQKFTQIAQPQPFIQHPQEQIVKQEAQQLFEQQKQQFMFIIQQQQLQLQQMMQMTQSQFGMNGIQQPGYYVFVPTAQQNQAGSEKVETVGQMPQVQQIQQTPQMQQMQQMQMFPQPTYSYPMMPMHMNPMQVPTSNLQYSSVNQNTGVEVGIQQQQFQYMQMPYNPMYQMAPLMTNSVVNNVNGFGHN